MNVSIFEYEDYRTYLRDMLEEKSRKNPSFSLRAFARDTGLSPSHLSRTLSGQKRLSASSAHLLSASLGLNARETSHLHALIELEKAARRPNENLIVKSLARQNRSRNKILSLETFQVIAHWYHFAIVALANTRGFESSTGWIARRLGIKALDARFAVNRLIEVGLLEEKNGAWRPTNDGQLSTTDDLRSAAIQENHRQHLELADKALKEIGVELREFNNLTLAMNLGDIPKAKKAIREFIDKFNSDMERRQGQEIFQLNVQFYPLSKQEKGQS